MSSLSTFNEPPGACLASLGYDLLLPPALQLARQRADAAAPSAAPFHRRSRGGGEGGAAGAAGAAGAGRAHQSAPGAGAVRAMESGLGARGGHGAVRVKHCATDMEAS